MHPVVQPTLKTKIQSAAVAVFFLLAAIPILFNLTNLSFPGTILNNVLLPVLSMLAFIFYLIIVRRFPHPSMRRAARWTSILSLLSGWLTPIFFLLMIIPPFTLAFFFTADEVIHEQHIQSEVSPDGTEVAEVYFRGVGAYSGGMGRMYVYMHPVWFPLVQSKVYANSRSDYGEGTSNYVHWRGNNTLVVADGDQAIPAHQLFFNPDFGFYLPIQLALALVELVNFGINFGINSGIHAAIHPISGNLSALHPSTLYRLIRETAAAVINTPPWWI